MNTKDEQLIYWINKHFNELQDVLKDLKSYDEFINPSNLIRVKAIKLDLFQIGENVNNLTIEIKNKTSKKDLRGIIDIRNYIAHGYVQVDESIIWDVINNDLPNLIKSLNSL